MPRKTLLTNMIEALADAVVARLKNDAIRAPATKRRRKLSAAGRERIRAAAKKRWAAYRKAKAARQ